MSIGLFDSGIGGLSVYQHIHKCLPNERIVYYADTLNVPYGSRNASDINHLTEQGVKFLIEQECQLIVIACNSASAFSLTALRQRYPDISFVGLVPAVKPAIQLTKTAVIAVLATQATLQGKLLSEVIGSQADPAGVTVLKYFEPSLVPWIEAGMPDEHPACQRLLGHVEDMLSRHVDTLVLGCTHYPFFRPWLQHRYPDLQLIDSGAAIARQVRRLVEQQKGQIDLVTGLPSDTVNRHVNRSLPLYVTGQTDTIPCHLDDLIGLPIEVQAVTSLY